MSMPRCNESNVEVVTSVQRHRRWTLEEKIGWVRRALAPGMTASLAAQEAGVAPARCSSGRGCTWRVLYQRCGLPPIFRQAQASG